ncbi:hypothetical protein BOTCAL_0248g00190 [Botryotinia calthae]|uniref:Uncharacterized protein n=1 Tax=Botryotinia calthae TaxID=38488 RepID=A0A4Y8CWR9_9HELO|nr:hypothetical protein BOTCAL_0248g00190 [Botryotinia calthae]
MSIWHQPGSIPALPVYVGTTNKSVKAQSPVQESVHDEKDHGLQAFANSRGCQKETMVNGRWYKGQ